MQKTRREILDIMKLKGSATLEELAREVGLSAVTIRAHLSILERDGLVSSQEVRGKVGRPHFLYSLGERAQERFPTAYHQVAHRFLEGIKTVATPEQLELLVVKVAEGWAKEKESRLAGKELTQRISEVARIRTEEGAMAEWEQTESGYILRQHHCPASRIAQLHPEVCRAELEYLRRLLGMSVVRESFLQGGEQKCSFRVEESSH